MNKKAMNVIEIYERITIHMREYLDLDNDLEPYQFVHHIRGRIYLYDSMSGKDTLIGKCTLIYIDIASAIDDGKQFSVFDVFDTDRKLHEYYFALFDSVTEQLRESLFGDEYDDEIFDYWIGGMNILILDILELLPDYRGQGLGLLIMRRLIQRYAGGAGIVAAKPFPLQYDPAYDLINNTRGEDDDIYVWIKSLGLSELIEDGDFETATARLQEHDAKLGFRFIPGHHPFMALPTIYKMPPISMLASNVLGQ